MSVFFLDSRALTLRVMSHETLYSLKVVRCIVQSDQETSQNTYVEHQSMPGTSSSKQRPGDVRLVMFSANQSEQMSLQTGTRIRINPPL